MSEIVERMHAPTVPISGGKQNPGGSEPGSCQNQFARSPIYAKVMSLIGYFVLTGWRGTNSPERDWGSLLAGAGVAFALSLLASHVAEPQSHR